MDDYLHSFPSLEQIVSVVVDVTELLKTSGFNLFNLVSNNQEILKIYHTTVTIKKQTSKRIFNQTSIERTLGILWDPEQDVLRSKVINKEVSDSNRGILSFVSSIFDPLGILTPALIKPKSIIQDLWKQIIDCDHPIPLDILDRQKKLKDTLDRLRAIEIPRWCRYT